MSRLWTLCLLLAAACSAQAHETAIAVLDVKQINAGEYQASWTYQSSVGRDPPLARFPEHCTFAPPRLSCGDQGLSGDVSLEGLGDAYSGAIIRVKLLDQPTRSFTMTAGQSTVTLTADGSVSWAQTARAYIPLGFEHILLGIDHLLFVLGLMWLVRSTWVLVKTITAFTIAHSITLAAATLGWVFVPEASVNALIALSIVFVAIEGLRFRRGHESLSTRHPWAVAFGFGLLHGFGFAGALTRLGLSPETIPAALLFFNVGVELGQLAFVFLVLGVQWAHRMLQASIPRVSQPAAMYAMGALATVWFIDRMVPVLAG
ncbi:MAG TPA: HupE/UreJ family protein [Steroidobacteraceae bacterium]|nr:HupE/UreJ family protein [Steroidobacteraceae bacterium]